MTDLPSSSSFSSTSRTLACLTWAACGLCVGLVLATGAIWLWWHFGGPGRQTQTLSGPAVVHEIQGLNELVSVKYTVQKVVGLEEQKVPLGTEKILLFVQAEVLAGVDLSKLSTTEVRMLGVNAIALALPPPAIQHIVIDDTQTKVWDRQITWWTPWVPYNQDLERKARVAARDMIERAALESGILEQARRNAESSIRALLQSTGAKSVTFVNHQ